MPAVVDSSILIAAFDREDPRRGQARSLLGRHGQIEVPVEVLGETLGVVHRRRSFATAMQLWTQLQAIPSLVFSQRSDLGAVAAVFAEAKGELTWVDAAVVARSRAGGLVALAFDRAIQRRSAA